MVHAHVNIARLYLKRCKGGRGLKLLSEYNWLWDFCEKLEEHMLIEVVKEDFMVEIEGDKSMIRWLCKGIKPTCRKRAYMESSLNQLQILRTVFRGNG